MTATTTEHEHETRARAAIQTLAALGEPDAIARHIAAAGVRMDQPERTHTDPTACAVAVYLRNVLGFYVSVGTSGTRVWTTPATVPVDEFDVARLPHDVGRVANPPALRKFLSRFDDGRYDALFTRSAT